MNLKHATLLCLLGLATTQAYACYTVYGRGNQVLYSSSEPPVDMSRPLHETVPALFPGGHLVFGSETDCLSVAARAFSQPLPPRRETVITELRNPPLTVVQTSDGVTRVERQR